MAIGQRISTEWVSFTSTNTSKTYTAPTGERILFAWARDEVNPANDRGMIVGDNLLGWASSEWDTNGMYQVTFKFPVGTTKLLQVMYYDI